MKSTFLFKLIQKLNVLLITSTQLQTFLHKRDMIEIIHFRTLTHGGRIVEGALILT